MTLVRSLEQRRRAVLPELVHVRAGPQQRARDAVVPALRGDPQRRGAVAARGGEVGAAAHECGAHVVVSVLRGDEQRRRFVLHAGVDVGPAADELVDDGQVSALARHEQRGAAVRAGRVDGGAGVQQQTRDVEEASLRREEQGARSCRPAAGWVGSLCQQLPDAVRVPHGCGQYEGRGTVPISGVNVNFPCIQELSQSVAVPPQRCEVELHVGAGFLLQRHIVY